MQTRASMKPETACEACRSIKLPTISHAANAMAVERAMADAAGVIKTEVDPGKRRLRVLYNTTITNFATIAELLEDIGFSPDDSWWNRVKASWYEYLDENTRTNARAPAPPCCNKPPK